MTIHAFLERMEVKKGDIVLVLVPEDTDTDMLNSACDSFEELMTERGASALIVPNTFRFKVVREKATE